MPSPWRDNYGTASDGRPLNASFAHEAAERGDLGFLREYLAAGGNPDATFASPATLLRTAAEHLQTGCARLLIEAGATVEDTQYGTESLIHATLNALVRRGTTGKTEAEIAAMTSEREQSRREIVAMLLDAGAKPDPGPNIKRVAGFYQQPLVLAIKLYDDALVDLFLKHNANLELRDKFDYTPLLHAISAYNLYAVRRLMDLGASLDAQGSLGQAPLSLAIQMRYLHGQGKAETIEKSRRMTRWLMDAGVRPVQVNDNGQNAIWQCIGANDDVILDWLIAAGADVNHRAHNWHTPLIALAQWYWNRQDADPPCLLSIAHKLLAAGADPDARDKTGKRAIDYAGELADQRLFSQLAGYAAISP